MKAGRKRTMNDGTKRRTVGFIGLGLMGGPMAGLLLAAGYPLRIHNRTREKGDALAGRGAAWCETPAGAARGASVVFTMVTNDDALRAVTLGDEGIASGLERGGVHVDCSTISPGLAASLELQHAQGGRTFFHMPVLGGGAQAAEGSLLLFPGGDPGKIREIREFFPVLGKRTWEFPSARHAACTKIACNSFISGLLVTLAQGMVFASRSGIGGSTLLEILDQSALNSVSLQRKGKAMIERDFAPSFFVENLLKDTRLMIDAAGELDMPCPGAKTARALLEEAVELGLGKEDYSAAVKVWEKASPGEAGSTGGGKKRAAGHPLSWTPADRKD
jgi:3-hydroxyisobutyrate dehydrogenase-like beta-hydroxyacid dehydrogenase